MKKVFNIIAEYLHTIPIKNLSRVAMGINAIWIGINSMVFFDMFSTNESNDLTTIILSVFLVNLFCLMFSILPIMFMNSTGVAMGLIGAALLWVVSWSIHDAFGPPLLALFWLTFIVGIPLLNYVLNRKKENKNV